MTDYMKEAERLVGDLIHAVDIDEDQSREDETRAALLAHIQRGAVLDKPARVGNGIFGAGLSTRYVVEAAQRLHEAEEKRGPRTLEKIHEEERIRRKTWEMFNGPLAAAPAPAPAEVPMPEIETKAYENGTVATGIAPLPNRSPIEQDAVSAMRNLEVLEALIGGRNGASIYLRGWIERNTPAPAVVPMPEPVAYAHGDALKWLSGSAKRSTQITLTRVQLDFNDTPINTADQMRTYGAAREAAGYARGLKEAGLDAERYRTVRFLATFLATAERDPLPDYEGDTSSPGAFDASIDRATAALRGEVK